MAAALLGVWLAGAGSSEARFPEARAADVVVLRQKVGSGTTRATGQVVDYTGERLLLRHATGREESIEPSRVLEIASDWSESHRSADALFDAAQFAQAVPAYTAALRDETRGWVRRRLAAQLVWCHRSLGQVEQAIDLFLSLHQQDPRTLYFDAIPLAWSTGSGGAGIERKAGELLARTDAPVAVLIGASWLVPTTRRAASLQALRGLLNQSDARVAFLADAQLWRAQLATVRPDELGRWRERWDRMPREIRAGPTFLLGQALGRLDRSDESALMLLRVPILHPRERELAVQSLWAAARQLEKSQDGLGARQLYSEIIEQYPESAVVAEARRALAQASRDGQP